MTTPPVGTTTARAPEGVEIRRDPAPRPPVPRRTVLHVAAAVLVAVAAGVHLPQAVAHLATDLGEAAFFALVGTAQLAVAAALVRRPGRSWLWAAVAAGLVPAAVWAWSRTAGLPVGPLPGVPEVASASDLLATGAEVLAALVAVGALGRGARPLAAAGARSLLALSALVGALLTTVGPLAHTHSGGSHHGVEDPRVDHRPDLLDPHRAPDDPLPGARVPVGDGPEGLALHDGIVWVGNRVDGTVTRVDAATGTRIGEAIPVGAGANRIAIADGVAWVTLYSQGAVARLDAASGAVLGGPVEVGALPYGIAAGHGSVWVANSAAHSVTRIDATTATVRATITTGYGPTDVLAAGRWVWVLEALERRVVRIDPRTDEVVGEPIPVGAGALAMAAGSGRIWVAATTAGEVTVIDQAAAEVVATIEVDRYPQLGGGPDAIAVGPGAVWVANNEDRRLVRLDPATLQVVGEPLYLANHHADRLFRQDVLVTPAAVFVTDPHADALVRIPRPGADPSGRPPAPNNR